MESAIVFASAVGAGSCLATASCSKRAPINAETMEPIERPAPSIIERDLVVQPVQTGLVVVDTLFALGRGQRELIIGDRAIGKTTIGIDTIINQKTSDIICVYIAVGQKSSSVRRAIDAIHAKGAPERSIVVVAGSASSPGCNGSRRLLVSPWRNTSAIEASTLWSWSTT
jgi:F0F1-type ATP synthase alpha subunit